MKKLFAALLLLLYACASPVPTQLVQVVQPTAQVTALIQVGVSLNGNPLFERQSSFVTNTPAPTATSTPTPTGTPTPTSTPAIVPVGWHAPGTHLDPISHLPLPVHEHGDAPPAWTKGSACVPFSQFREGHIFYKGMYATDKGGKGVESYLIVHVATTVSARSHGDHDIMAFFRTPGSGVVSCFQALLDFGSPPPLITTTTDPGFRPIILSKIESGQPGFSDCETWYNRPGQLVFDLGWTVCNRWQKFDGSADGGNGAHRGSDWHVYVDRFGEWPGMDPALVNFAVDDGFGHKRLDFVRNDISFPADGVTGPN